jgi:hypothetical protein
LIRLLTPSVRLAAFISVSFKTGLTLELLVPTLSPLVVVDEPAEGKKKSYVHTF